jgi:hypothetical protein
MGGKTPKQVELLHGLRSIDLEETAADDKNSSEFSRKDLEARDALVGEVEKTLSARNATIGFSYEAEVASYAQQDPKQVEKCARDGKAESEKLEDDLRKCKADLAKHEIDLELTKKRLEALTAKYKEELDRFKSLPKEIGDLKANIAKQEAKYAELLSQGKVAEAEELRRRTAEDRLRLETGLCSVDEIKRRWQRLYWSWRVAHVGEEPVPKRMRWLVHEIGRGRVGVDRLEKQLAHRKQASSSVLWRCLANPEQYDPRRPDGESARTDDKGGGHGGDQARPDKPAEPGIGAP